MKTPLLALMILVPTLLHAEPWESYANARFGFWVDVPAGLSKSESDNGDGATFSNAEGTVTISVYGTNIVEGTFSDQLAFSRETLAGREAEIGIEQDGGDWFMITGDASGRRYYHHALALCDGAQSANLWFDYAAVEGERVDGWIEQMITSLEALDDPATCP
jgi:hypothetical protein